MILPDDLPAHGHDPHRFSVARAVRMSAAVPFLFRPVPMVNRRTGEHLLITDGAMTANYPIGAVRRDRPVLGFRLVPEGDHPHHIVTGPASLARAVVISGIRARYDLPRPIDQESIELHIPVTADLDFTISNDEARTVFDRARLSAARQLEDSVLV
jgi:NTE family protein